jgi:succinyl-CoA synthetase alpha subunit
MSILIDRQSRILIQGITGAMGQIYAERMRAGGTPLVGGVTPGKGGQVVAGVPVFNSVREAVSATGATAMLSVVPRAYARDALYEAVESGIQIIVVYIENIPVHDAIQMRAYASTRGVRLIGPNSAGIVSPGEANLSDLNDVNLIPGRIGIVSKSGTLTYEVIEGLHRYGMGESTVACIGGDPVIGTTYADLLPLFEADPNTDLVVLIGEPGGHLEYAALHVIQTMRTPVVAYFAGLGAPPEKRMGHAGAISSDVGGTAASAKAAAYRRAGCTVATLVTDVAPCVATKLGKIAAEK